MTRIRVLMSRTRFLQTSEVKNLFKVKKHRRLISIQDFTNIIHHLSWQLQRNFSNTRRIFLIISRNKFCLSIVAKLQTTSEAGLAAAAATAATEAIL